MIKKKKRKIYVKQYGEKKTENHNKRFTVIPSLMLATRNLSNESR